MISYQTAFKLNPALEPAFFVKWNEKRFCQRQQERGLKQRKVVGPCDNVRTILDFQDWRACLPQYAFFADPRIQNVREPIRVDYHHERYLNGRSGFSQPQIDDWNEYQCKKRNLCSSIPAAKPAPISAVQRERNTQNVPDRRCPAQGMQADLADPHRRAEMGMSSAASASTSSSWVNFVPTQAYRQRERSRPERTLESTERTHSKRK